MNDKGSVMSLPKIGLGLLGFVIITTVIIVFRVDVFGPHHLFNENWPGHARFHIVMQATALFIVSLFSLWALIKMPKTKEWLAVAILAPVSFWSGIIIGPLVEGTDIYASEALRAVGFPINFALAIIYLSLSITGYILALKKGKDD